MCTPASRCRALLGRRENIPWGGAPCRGRVCHPLIVGAGGRASGPGSVPLTRVPRGKSRVEGVAGGRSRWGCPLTVMRGVGCQALSLSQPPALGAGSRAPTPCFPGAGGVGLGAKHLPCSVRCCEPASRAVGAAGGLPRGGCLVPLSGSPGVRRSPSPGCSPPARAVGVRCPRVLGAGVRVWGPGTVPLACVPCGGLRAAGVAAEGRPGGDRLSLLSGASGVRSFPSPGRPSLAAVGQAMLPVFPGYGRCGRGDPAPDP